MPTIVSTVQSPTRGMELTWRQLRPSFVDQTQVADLVGVGAGGEVAAGRRR